MQKRILTVIGIGLGMSVLVACGTNKSEVEDFAQIQENSSFILYPQEEAKELEQIDKPEFIAQDIRGISVVADGEILYELNYTPRQDRDSYLYWDLVTPYASTAIVNTEEMYALYEQIASIDFQAAEIVLEGADTGIADSDTYMVLNYFASSQTENGQTQEINPNYSFTLLIGNKTEDAYYCAIKGYETNVFQLLSEDVENILSVAPYDLILKIPHAVNVATVKELNIFFEDKEYKMTLEGSAYKINGKKTDANTYCSLYSKLMDIMLDGELKEEDRKKEHTEYIKLQYLRNVDYAENYEIIIYELEDENYTVSINGEENFFLNQEDVKLLEQSIKDGFEK